MSNMWSTSSKTTCFTLERSSLLFWMWSLIRPGVPTRISMPILRRSTARKETKTTTVSDYREKKIWKNNQYTAKLLTLEPKSCTFLQLLSLHKSTVALLPCDGIRNLETSIDLSHKKKAWFFLAKLFISFSHFYGNLWSHLHIQSLDSHPVPVYVHLKHTQTHNKEVIRRIRHLQSYNLSFFLMTIYWK